MNPFFGDVEDRLTGFHQLLLAPFSFLTTPLEKKKSSINASLLLSPPCFTSLVIGNRYRLAPAIESCYWRHGMRPHHYGSLSFCSSCSWMATYPKSVANPDVPTGPVPRPAAFKKTFWRPRGVLYMLPSHSLAPFLTLSSPSCIHTVPTYLHPRLLPHLSPPDRSPPPPLVSLDPGNVALYYYGNGG